MTTRDVLTRALDQALGTVAMDWQLSPNCRARRWPITAIVLHYTGTLSMASTLEWFARPQSQVSAHYVIGRDGRLVQCVDDEDVAWHAGVSAMRRDLPKGDPAREDGVNRFSIGIELVGTDRSGFTGEQLQVCEALVSRLAVQHHVPLARIVGHADICVPKGRKIDPDGIGHQFPWTRLRLVVAAALVEAARA